MALPCTSDPARFQRHLQGEVQKRKTENDLGYCQQQIRTYQDAVAYPCQWYKYGKFINQGCGECCKRTYSTHCWQRTKRSEEVNNAREFTTFHYEVCGLCNTCSHSVFMLSNLSTNRLANRLRKGEDTISFDKDDDDTLDFVTAASNLRSAAYGIEGKTRWEVKGMSSAV